MKGYLLGKLLSKVPIFVRIIGLIIILALFFIYLTGCAVTPENDANLSRMNDAQTIQYTDAGDWQIVFDKDFAYYEQIQIKDDYVLIILYNERLEVVGHIYTKEFYIVERRP